jgi:putative ABC transport system permease protein
VNPLQALAMAAAAIRGNVLRSFLTALGVIIGVATVIAVVALGQGSREAITRDIQGLGSNLITAAANPREGAHFTAPMAAELAAEAPDIAAATPEFATTGTVAYGTAADSSTEEIGVNQDWPRMRGASLAAGSFFTAAQVAAAADVAVLGQTTMQNLGLTLGDAVGTEVTVGTQPVTVIGVLASLGSSGIGPDPNEVIVLPYTTAEQISLTAYPSELLFQAKAAPDATLIVGTLNMIFASMFPRQNSVFVSSQDQLLSTLSSASRTETVTLGAIAGISLLVGGIGIMNIMLVSVTERTREIGLRKAIGAKRRAILLQFLLEAVLLSGAGGLVGVAAGVAGAHLLGTYLKTTVAVTPISAVVGFCFAVAVGLLFGYWPAASASRLDPIVALRHD